MMNTELPESERPQTQGSVFEERPVQPEPVLDNGWWATVIAFLLLAVGSLLLFMNFGLFQIFDVNFNLTQFEFTLPRLNGWALWFLIPIFFTAMGLFPAIFRDGDTSEHVQGKLMTLLVLSSLLVIFLFDMDWGRIWPIWFVIGGLSKFMWGGRRRWCWW